MVICFPQIRNIPSAYNKHVTGFGSFTAAKYGTRCPAHEYGTPPCRAVFMRRASRSIRGSREKPSSRYVFIFFHGLLLFLYFLSVFIAWLYRFILCEAHITKITRSWHSRTLSAQTINSNACRLCLVICTYLVWFSSNSTKFDLYTRMTIWSMYLVFFSSNSTEFDLYTRMTIWSMYLVFFSSNSTEFDLYTRMTIWSMYLVFFSSNSTEFDLYTRMTIWSMTIGGIFGWAQTLGVSQTSVQRYCAIPTVWEGQK